MSSDMSNRVSDLSAKQRAYLALKEMQAKLDEYERARSEPIAVVGMGCQFPGAEGVEAFWDLLRNGVDAIREVPKDRYDVDDFYDPDLSAPGTMNTRWGGYLRNVSDFDAGFFGISVREASSIDPQQRLLLEVSWEALENAGIAASQLAGSNTGVFMGISGFDYAFMHAEAPPRGGTGLAFSIAANRLSYFYDFRGPSMIVDTACSSSLVAVDLASQSLRNRDVDVALAGAVNVLLFPQCTVALAQAGFMAPDGHCKTFDAAADGYVRGEGCGIVVLKRLSDAIAEGHHIIGLVLGTAVNQDGRSNGLTAPNGLSQQAAVRQALRKAKVQARQISYLEAHGTGTSLGDVVEVEALWSALGEGRGPDEVCHIGSVKTNIGHIEPASGMAGLIKVLLSLKHEQIPPNLNLKKINPNLRMDARLKIPTALEPWPRSSEPRYAGISAFGFGGTNSHAIVSEGIVRTPVTPEVDRPVHVLSLSGKSAKALAELARRYADHCSKHPEDSLADICYTANSGRSHFEQRLVARAATRQEMQASLAAFAQSGESPSIRKAVAKARTHARIAFVFPGEASVYAGMGRELYHTQPTFKRALDRCDEFLRSRLEKPLLSVLFPDASANSDIEMAYRGPAAFAIEYGLALLWQSWGIEPSAVQGEGAGEFVAACVAGVLGWEDALDLCAEKSKAAAGLPSAFAAKAAACTFQAPRIQMVSGRTGQFMEPGFVPDATYWSGETVIDGMPTLHSSGCDFILAMGAGADESANGDGKVLGSLKSTASDWDTLLSSVTTLYLSGIAVDWKGFDRDYPRQLVALPTYPFERKRCWLEPFEIRPYVGPLKGTVTKVEV